MNRYFSTHFVLILLYALVALGGGYLIAGDSSWRTLTCIVFSFFLGIHLGFGEAVDRFKQIRRTSKVTYNKSDVRQG